MKKSVACIVILAACSYLHAQDLGRSGPPYVEATVTMPAKLMKNAEKRCEMVSELAEKSEMNYRLLGMKIMEKWQASIKSDKDFLKNLMQYKAVAFTVRKDGSIVIKGVEDSSKKATKPGDKTNSANSSPATTKASNDN